MSKTPKKDEFFVGYNAKLSSADRRAMILTAGIGLVGVALGGAKAAVHQQGWGSGDWDMGEVRDIEGIVEQTPYPVLRTAALDGQMRSVSLVCSSKCGASAILAPYEGKPVWVRGTVISRGRHRLLAVVDNQDWLGDAKNAVAAPPVEEEYLGLAALNGEILDAKCWAGAMRPGSGKTHKACASLCIRMGGTPWFVAKDKAGKRAIFVLTGPEGEPLREEVLAMVGEPVRASGKLMRRDDLVQFRVDPAVIQAV